MTATRLRSIACIATAWVALSRSATAQMVINEVRSRPAGMEFLELYNSGTSAVDLSGWSFGPAIQFAFPQGSWAAPGEYLVVARDPDMLRARGPTIPEGVRVFPWGSGELSAAGPLRLLDASEGVQSAVDEAVYAADLRGASVELLNSALPTNSARAWRGSVLAGGTPGARNSRFTAAPILLAETPERGSSAKGLTQIAVLFSEKMTHVYAADLTVDGVPARRVSGTGAGPYVFDVQAPAAAVATVSLGAAGGIQGERGVAFPGESWQYATLAATTLGLPHNAQGGPGTIVQVPISATPADGIYSIDTTIHYDPAVIQADSVSTSGLGSAAGFSTFANLTTLGEILVSTFANSNPLSGSGEFARIQFHVVGSPGATSPLAFISASVNENGVPAAFDPGVFSVTCAGASNGTPCSDANGCTVNDTCQSGVCAPGTPITVPSEIAGVALASNKSSISWSAATGVGPGVVYDVVRGRVGQWPVGSGAAETCIATSTSATTALDATTPGAQTSFWYLTRARNSCGIGSYGYQELHGVPTLARITTACP